MCKQVYELSLRKDLEYRISEHGLERHGEFPISGRVLQPQHCQLLFTFSFNPVYPREPVTRIAMKAKRTISENFKEISTVNGISNAIIAICCLNILEMSMGSVLLLHINEISARKYFL